MLSEGPGLAASGLAAVFVAASVLVVSGFAGEGPGRSPMASRPGMTVESAPPEVLARGEQVYRRHCQACHGRGGSGGVAPRLSGGEVIRRFPDVGEQVAFVSDGSRRGEPYGVGGEGTGGMPGWGERLDEGEIQAVVAYERSR